MWDDMVHRPTAYLHGESFPKDNVMHVGDDTIVIELALAGYRKEDIEVERDGTFLTVSGKKDEAEETEEVSYIRKNIATRAFTKRYTISTEFKDIQARYDMGILTITLSREPKEDSSMLVEIN